MNIPASSKGVPNGWERVPLSNPLGFGKTTHWRVLVWVTWKPMSSCLSFDLPGCARNFHTVRTLPLAIHGIIEQTSLDEGSGSSDLVSHFFHVKKIGIPVVKAWSLQRKNGVKLTGHGGKTKKTTLQGRPLSVISGVITSISRVITSVTQL